MQLLAAWKDSLSLLKPAHFKLFFLVTLKSLKETYKVWLKYWGWLLVGFVAVNMMMVKQTANSLDLELQAGGFKGIIINFLAVGPTFLFFAYPFVLLAMIISLLYITVYLSARASIKIKNFSYFFSYGVNALYSFIWFLVLPFINMAFFAGLILFAFWLGYSKTDSAPLYFGGIIFFYLITMAALSIFFMLFLFDSDGSLREALKSLKRAISMYLYNFPFIFILGAGIIGFYYLLMYCLGLLFSFLFSFEALQLLLTILTILYLPIIACFTTNFYIKKIHDQFNLYFETK